MDHNKPPSLYIPYGLDNYTVCAPGALVERDQRHWNSTSSDPITDIKNHRNQLLKYPHGLELITTLVPTDYGILNMNREEFQMYLNAIHSIQGPR